MKGHHVCGNQLARSERRRARPDGCALITCDTYHTAPPRSAHRDRSRRPRLAGRRAQPAERRAAFRGGRAL